MPPRGEKITDEKFLETLANARAKGLETRKARAAEKKEILAAKTIAHAKKLGDARKLMEKVTAPKADRKKRTTKPKESESEPESETSDTESESSVESAPPPPKVKKASKKAESVAAPPPLPQEPVRNKPTPEQLRMLHAYKSLFGGF